MLLLALALAGYPTLAPSSDLDARLRASDSATAVLQQICDARAPGQKIWARPLVNMASASAPPAVRRDLHARRGETIAYRRVELGCAGEVFSRAENWYLPDRLTPEMRQTLAISSTPFGVVVRPLGYHRETLQITALFPRSASRDATVLQHRAVLVAGEGGPFSLVIERYARATIEPLR